MDTRIVDFIKEHHVATCAFTSLDKIHCASCFYEFLNNPPRFIIASNMETKHVKMVIKNPNIAGTIHFETEEIGKIQGIQFNGLWRRAKNEEVKAYLKRFPYAIILNPKLWRIDITYIKFTDNRLGFGKKLEFFT